MIDELIECVIYYIAVFCDFHFLFLDFLPFCKQYIINYSRLETLNSF